jgi:hypothetical protein
MLMHVYGADTYRRSRAIREIVAKYQAKYPDGTVGYFDFEDDDALAALRSFAGAPGLFAKASLAIVYNPGDGEKPLAKLLKELAEQTHVTILVVADKKLPKDFAFLYEKGIGPAKAEFEPLEGMDFLKFLKADMTERGLSLTDMQYKQIGDEYAGDTWGAITEAERVAGGGAFEGKGTQIDFIGLIRALAGGNRVEQRLKALLLLLDYDEPAKIFNMAAAFVQGQGKIKMADYDVAIKSGKLDYAEALLEYALTAN